MAETISEKPTRGFWIIGGVALIWNLLGVMAYLLEVTMSPEALAALPEAQRALYADIPVWVTSAYAIAVFAGVLGAIALLLRKGWAVPLFAVSLLAIVVQMGHSLFLTEAIAVLGPAAAIMPVLLIAIGAFLLWYSHATKQKGWLG